MRAEGHALLDWRHKLYGQKKAAGPVLTALKSCHAHGLVSYAEAASCAEVAQQQPWQLINCIGAASCLKAHALNWLHHAQEGPSKLADG
jgi:hypothetical protein